MFLQQTFVIYHDNGKVEFIEDMWSYVWNFGGINRFYGSMKFNISAYNKKKSQSYGSYFSPSFEHDSGFFLCTESGKMVSPDLFLSSWKEYSTWHYNKHYYNKRTQRSWRYSHTTAYNKSVHTIPAKRAACAVLKEEGEPPFRGARTKGSLPDNWDDLYSRKSCSWKDCTTRKRKHQYKGS